jgi:hypothetical protein
MQLRLCFFCYLSLHTTPIQADIFFRSSRMFFRSRNARNSGGYTMRVCIFWVRCTLLAGISIVYLNLGKIKSEYTMRVCIWILKKNSDEQTAHRYFFYQLD